MEHLIYNKLSYDEHLACIESFLPIYEEAFPDADEREEWEAIQARICDPDAFPKTILFFDQPKDPSGGIIADIYSEIGVVHLIYIAVSKEKRGKGIASMLIKEHLPKAIEQIQVLFHFDAKALYSSQIFLGALPKTPLTHIKDYSFLNIWVQKRFQSIIFNRHSARQKKK